jgi:hypothetical protein
MNKCSICNNTVHNFDEKLNSKYIFCKICEYICLKKAYIVNETDEKKRYLLHNNSNNLGYIRMFNNFITKAILPFCNNNINSLDFGCGSVPVLAELLKERKFNVDIYDKYFFKDKIYQGKKYDLITITEVIEHLYDPLKYFRLFINHLNKNGIIAGTTLFHHNNSELFEKWWYKNDITHVSFYSEKTIRYIANILNLNVLLIDDKNIFVLSRS